MAEIKTLDMEKMAALGEAVTMIDNSPIYVPFSLGGEKVTAEVSGSRGKLLEVLTPSPDRIEPICPHFTICGGCSLQHWNEAKVLEWKAGLINKTLEKAGISGVLAEVKPAWGEGRRRAKFSARRVDGQIQFGFMGQKSNDIIDIQTCPILTPNLQAALPKLRELSRSLVQGREELSLSVTDSDNGLDVDINGLKPINKFARQDLEKLAKISAIAGLSRLTLQTENAYVQTTPYVKMGDAIVELPPNAFLQACKNCENLLGDLVVIWAKGKKRISDLFCGIGTFALRLKLKAEITAYEVHQPSIVALNQAAKKMAGGHNLAGHTRDLFRVPVSPLELKNIDLVVLDPARQGAEAQCKQLVRTQKLNHIIYVSCDPQSFARDAKILVDGGYTLKEIQGFDQFRFSPHVELAARFERKI